MTKSEMGNKAPRPPAILMVMWTHRSNGHGINQCSMSKPLDATIEQLLAPYCPVGCQGNKLQNDDEKYTYFAGRFEGHRDAPVRYRAHRPMEVVQGFPKSP
jgi:hypothetical protein